MSKNEKHFSRRLHIQLCEEATCTEAAIGKVLWKVSVLGILEHKNNLKSS